MVHFALLTGVQAFLALAFYVAVLAFVMTRRTRLGPQAARLARVGAGVLLAGWLFSAGWPLLFGAYSQNFSGGPGFPAVAALLSFLATAAHLVGIALLVMAVFAERPAAALGYRNPPAPGAVPPWAGPDGTDQA